MFVVMNFLKNIQLCVQSKIINQLIKYVNKIGFSMFI